MDVTERSIQAEQALPTVRDPSLDRTIDGRNQSEVIQAIAQLDDKVGKHEIDLFKRHAAQRDRGRLVRKARSMDWSLEYMATKKPTNKATPPKVQPKKSVLPRIPCSLDSLDKLERIVVRFIDGHRISCPEAIVQKDGVLMDAAEFIENLAKVVGYYRGE